MSPTPRKFSVSLDLSLPICEMGRQSLSSPGPEGGPHTAGEQVLGNVWLPSARATPHQSPAGPGSGSPRPVGEGEAAQARARPRLGDEGQHLLSRALSDHTHPSPPGFPPAAERGAVLAPRYGEGN